MNPLAPACKFVNANGLRFAYLESGSGPLVLLAHGFPDTAQSWDAVRPVLAEAGYRVVAPFMRGYAPTDIPADNTYDADTLGRDLLALIEALGERKAVIVGHDWGAVGAYSAAALDPEKVLQLVTVPVPHPAGASPTPAWDVPQDATVLVKEAFAAPERVEAALEYYRAMRPWLSKGLRLRVAVPTVCFSGDDDIMDPRRYEQARARFLGPYRIIRMPGGHFMHREHPNRFCEELLTALSTCLKSSPTH